VTPATGLAVVLPWTGALVIVAFAGVAWILRAMSDERD
jgi:hypothetical protein